MTADECPVKLDELRAQLRRPVAGSLDDTMQGALLAAAEYIEGFCGRKFSEFGDDFPYQLRQAVLLKAASLFENPVHRVDERTTVAQRLANPRLWRIETTT